MFREADWERLQEPLAGTCWDHIVDQSTSSAAQRITDTIPRSASSSVALVDAKRAAEGTPLEKETTLTCSAGLAAAYHDCTARTAQKMRCLRPSFKLWWKKAKDVMKHEAQVSSAEDQRGRLGDGWAGQG